MNKQEFLLGLEKQLRPVSPDEAAAALEYYREYFDEAGEENEAEVIKELGTPERVAAQIRANVAMRNLEVQKPTVQKGISAIWLVILAIFAAPIALPLAFAALAVVIALSIAAVAIVVSLIIAVIAVFGSGIVAIGAGIVTLTTNLGAAICSIGLGFVIMGITLLLGMLVIVVARSMSRLIAKLTNEFFKKVGKGGENNGK